MEPGSPLLSVSDLESSYGPVRVLHSISLFVGPGEVVSLLGPNGAGKTTTVRSILGLIPKVSGHIEFNGTRISGMMPHRIVDLGISVVPEGRGVFPGLTVVENLRSGALFRTGGKQMLKDGIARAFQSYPILAERQQQLAGTLSGGEQTMLALSRAMMSNPSLILMDEPSLGLAPKLIDDCFEVVAELGSRGVAVLLIEQNAAQALNVCSRAYVLQKGRIALSGSRDDLLADERIRHAYFQTQ